MKRIVTKILASVAIVGALSLLGGTHFTTPNGGGAWPTPVIDL